MSKPLLKDLQELVEANVITADTAQQITDYYQSKDNATSNKFNLVLGILGAILVGSGIVLLIAHNWDELTKIAKTIIAFIPLALAQAACIYTLLRKKENRAWQESGATLLFFAVATCMALISQVYHIDGTLTEFLLTWLFIMLPVIYLMNSSIVSLLSIAGITWYACLDGYSGVFSSQSSYPYLYFVFLLLIVPHYYRFAKFNRHSNFFHLHNWFLVLSWCFALGAFTGRHAEADWIFAGYMSLFGILYLLGNTAYFREYKLFANPGLLIGLPGILVILMIGSYEQLWRQFHDRTVMDYFESPLSYITILFLMAGIVVLVRHLKQKIDPVVYCVYIFCLMAFLFTDARAFPAFIINCSILMVAIFYIRKGSLQNHLGILNFGLLIIAILALLRFFDDGIPFIWRGIFFVAAGAGFFVANYLLLKKRKTLIQNNEP